VFSKIGALRERFYDEQILAPDFKDTQRRKEYIPGVTLVRGEGPHFLVLSNMH